MDEFTKNMWINIIKADQANIKNGVGSSFGEMEIIEGANGYDEYEHCWESGNYEDQYCPLCPHYSECCEDEHDD